MKPLVRILLTLCCAVLLAGTADSVILSGINQGTMAELFAAYSRPRGHDEITAADYPAIAGEIVAYLKTGREEDLPEMRGERLFSERENLHLKDVSAIIRGMTAFRNVFLCLLALMCALYLFLRMKRGAARAADFARLSAGCMAAACMAVSAAVLALVVWGLINFEGLFITFHLVFFHNDLWILDTERDLLIQLMPYAFFERYAAKLMISLIPCVGLIMVFPALYLKFVKKKDAVS